MISPANDAVGASISHFTFAAQPFTAPSFTTTVVPFAGSAIKVG